MKKIIFILFSFCSFAFSAGTYDGYAFTDEEEKYSLHFVNTSLSTEMTGIGLTTTDSTAILGLRPITSLTTVASNTNITGRDMLLIRSRSYAVEIPDHSVYNEYTALGIKQYEFNFLMALMGSFVGFTFVFFFVYVVVNISRGFRS
ncbi:MAG: hypothetical protein A3I60_00400 [Sulfuricurvum sp. RIFCSPLOWO2_02_FULL_43_45]|nr:MAG: hypothetical protein A3I60_00400 [Sulfuricurvum sp. RIFCSPLOWO2_02_FULL_43_45]